MLSLISLRLFINSLLKAESSSYFSYMQFANSFTICLDTNSLSSEFFHLKFFVCKTIFPKNSKYFIVDS